MTSEPEDDRLDQQLRSKFEYYAPPPTDTLWAGIAPNIGPPPPLRRWRRPLPLPLLFGLTALLAGLVGWLLPHRPAPATSGVPQGPSAVLRPSALPANGLQKTLRSAGTTSAEAKKAFRNSVVAAAGPRTSRWSSGAANSVQHTQLQSAGTAGLVRRSLLRSARMALPPAGSRPLAAAPPLTAGKTGLGDSSAASIATETAAARQWPASTPAADSLPATLRPLAALEHQTLEQLPGTATLAAGPLEAESRTRFVGTLRRERAELLRLQRRTDSLLLALGDILPAVPALAVHPDSTKKRITDNKQLTTNRWSLLLTATPEQNTLTLEGPAGDSLTALRRNHETGRAGFSAGVLAEYQLTPRLSVGGGVGYTTFGADLRITNKITDVRVTYDTTTTRSFSVYTSTYQTHSIRIIQVPQLSPVFNGSGQVIRYDTVYVPRQDTVYTTTIQRDTTHTTNRTITPNISKKETLTTRLLQPNYRFFTVPVLLRYRLAAPGTSRLWTDVALGAQLQFFLGGTQVVTNDGENFRTERITVGSSPFRALNVALSGSLALNYALTPRLSVSVAPSIRWQALSLYKPETGLRQQPTATGLLFGVRFGL